MLPLPGDYLALGVTHAHGMYATFAHLGPNFGADCISMIQLIQIAAGMLLPTHLSKNNHKCICSCYFCPNCSQSHEVQNCWTLIYMISLLQCLVAVLEIYIDWFHRKSGSDLIQSDLIQVKCNWSHE